MGLLLFPVFKPAIRGLNLAKTTGEFLMHELDKLEKIATTNGLTPVSAFGDNREVPEDFDGSPEDLDDVLGEWDEWFDAAAGHAAFKSLADLLRSNPKTAKKLRGLEGILHELDDLARVVGIAAKKRARFRLETG